MLENVRTSILVAWEVGVELVTIAPYMYIVVKAIIERDLVGIATCPLSGFGPGP